MNVFCTPFQTILIIASCYASLFFIENSVLQGSTDKEVFDAGTIFLANTHKVVLTAKVLSLEGFVLCVDR